MKKKVQTVLVQAAQMLERGDAHGMGGAIRRVVEGDVALGQMALQPLRLMVAADGYYSLDKAMQSILSYERDDVRVLMLCMAATLVGDL